MPQLLIGLYCPQLIVGIFRGVISLCQRQTRADPRSQASDTLQAAVNCYCIRPASQTVGQHITSSGTMSMAPCRLHLSSTQKHWQTVCRHLAVSGLTVRLPVWPWQQVCVKRVRKWGVRATWIFIMTSPVYWLQRGGHTQVRLFGPPESTVNWPGRRREEGGSEHIAHIRVIQVLPVADNWIDEDGLSLS